MTNRSRNAWMHLVQTILFTEHVLLHLKPNLLHGWLLFPMQFVRFDVLELNMFSNFQNKILFSRIGTQDCKCSHALFEAHCNHTTVGFRQGIPCVKQSNKLRCKTGANIICLCECVSTFAFATGFVHGTICLMKTLVCKVHVLKPDETTIYNNIRN